MRDSQRIAHGDGGIHGHYRPALRYHANLRRHCIHRGHHPFASPAQDERHLLQHREETGGGAAGGYCCAKRPPASRRRSPQRINVGFIVVFSR
ncbi:hypothetical protein KCP75_18840 [Salmonella enterica subsp. enterica]|nr:hypothetical protein KCP75_18840 [Salmonella enterica subsp. enterica]